MGHGSMATGTTAMATRVVLLFCVAIIEADPFFVSERFTSAQHDGLRSAVLIHAQSMMLLIGFQSLSEDTLQCRFHVSSLYASGTSSLSHTVVFTDLLPSICSTVTSQICLV
jgi:hypothetical protein